MTEADAVRIARHLWGACAFATVLPFDSLPPEERARVMRRRTRPVPSVCVVGLLSPDPLARFDDDGGRKIYGVHPTDFARALLDAEERQGEPKGTIRRLRSELAPAPRTAPPVGNEDADDEGGGLH